MAGRGHRCRGRCGCGGLLGKAGGEYIDPTVDDTYLRDTYPNRPYFKKGDTFETHIPAYQYGGRAEATYGGRPYEEIEPELRTGWQHKDMPWEHASPPFAMATSDPVRSALWQVRVDFNLRRPSQRIEPSL